MKSILIIGKKSFIAKNINIYLKKYFILKKISYLQFQKIKRKELTKFNYLINCSLSKKYVQNKYSESNDFDFQIAKKIYKTPIRMVFLSSRKVYKYGNNLKETSILKPKCYYSMNKIITEKKLNNILSKNVLILRISNLIGNFSLDISHRKIHYTFIDNFFLNIKKNIIFDNKKLYKDFITAKKFCEILRKLMSAKAYGIFNVSIGKKIFLRDLVSWLNYHNNKKDIRVLAIPNNFNKDCFYLNNSKLKKKINIKISILELKKYCIKISKNFF